MQARILIRPLLVPLALVFAGSAIAQSAEKERSTASKQSAAKSPTAKSAPVTTKRLDFVPSGSVKETSTRPQSSPAPAKDSSLCDHAGAADA